jgi:putative endonuclease
VYIMSSPNRNVLYTGVTAELGKRVYQHKNKHDPGDFSAKYNCVVLVYYKHYDSITEAIAEEKRIKGGNRKQKEALINSINPQWNDLLELVL